LFIRARPTPFLFPGDPPASAMPLPLSPVHRVHTGRPAPPLPGRCCPHLAPRVVAGPPSSASRRRVAATHRSPPLQLRTPCPFLSVVPPGHHKRDDRRPSPFFTPSPSSTTVCRVLSSTDPPSTPPVHRQRSRSSGPRRTPPLPPPSAIRGELGHTPPP
jgi:hypothetical protein